MICSDRRASIISTATQNIHLETVFVHWDSRQMISRPTAETVQQATRPYYSCSPANVDALEQGSTGRRLQRVDNFALDPTVRPESNYFEGIGPLVDRPDDGGRRIESHIAEVIAGRVLL